MTEDMVERVAKAIERQLDVVEMVDAAPSVIRALRAKRIARAAIEAIQGARMTYRPISDLPDTSGWAIPASQDRRQS